MGCGGGADMIRDGLWERERKGKTIKRRKKRWQWGWLGCGQVVFGLQVAPPPLSSALQSRNLLSTLTNQSMIASNYPLATARHVSFY